MPIDFRDAAVANEQEIFGYSGRVDGGFSAFDDNRGAIYSTETNIVGGDGVSIIDTSGNSGPQIGSQGGADGNETIREAVTQVDSLNSDPDNTGGFSDQPNNPNASTFARSQFANIDNHQDNFRASVDFGMGAEDWDRGDNSFLANNQTDDVFQLSDIPITQLTGGNGFEDYFVFGIDVNENSSTNEIILSQFRFSVDVNEDGIYTDDEVIWSLWNPVPTGTDEASNNIVMAGGNNSVNYTLYIPVVYAFGANADNSVLIEGEFLAAQNSPDNFVVLTGDLQFLPPGTTVVPLPAAIWLMLIGLGGLAGLGRLTRRQKTTCAI